MDVDAILRDFSDTQVAVFMLVLARVAPLFVLAPLFSSKMLPARARTVIAVALAVGLSPLARASMGDHGHVPLDALPFAGILLKELLVGGAFAFGLAALFAALSAAGSLLDTLVGFSFGSLIDPINGTQSSMLSQLYSLFGLAVFIAIDGDAWVIRGTARTYDAVPLLDAPQLATLVGGVQAAFSGIFLAALEVAAPVLLALILTDAAFGLVARVVPQLNVFQVGFPAKVAVGFVVIGASLPFVSGWIAGQLESTVATALHTLRVA